MTTLPLVTILVPTRNEASDIDGCLAAIAAQDHPVNCLEVIVVDGCSTDGTADVAQRALARWGFRSTAVVSNEGATASSNLNIGLERATGEIVCRVDARTRIEPHYVRACVTVLTSRPDVSVVGGAQIAIPRNATAKAMGIARALNNRWSMGGSPYRRVSVSGPSDTVYLGAFRREQLIAVGGWDERLVTNQDFDLNRRMAALGEVWFEASLRSAYIPRSTYGELWRQYRRFGRWKVRYWRITGDRPRARQAALLGGPPVVAFTALMWLTYGPPARRLRLSVALGAVAAAIVDAEGSETREASVAARVTGMFAMSLIAAGWWSGAAGELASRQVASSDDRMRSSSSSQLRSVV